MNWLKPAYFKKLNVKRLIKIPDHHNLVYLNSTHYKDNLINNFFMSNFISLHTIFTLGTTIFYEYFKRKKCRSVCKVEKRFQELFGLDWPTSWWTENGYGRQLKQLLDTLTGGPGNQITTITLQKTVQPWHLMVIWVIGLTSHVQGNSTLFVKRSKFNLQCDLQHNRIQLWTGYILYTLFLLLV